MLMLKGEVATTRTFSGGPSGAMKREKKINYLATFKPAFARVQ